jgi:hypothetical protein
MGAYANHAERLQFGKPDAVPVQEAIIEKQLRDNNLPKVMVNVERLLARDD